MTIVACGEALIDLTPVRHGDEWAYLPRPGGSPFNVAIAAARLGGTVGFLGRLSADAFGDLLRDTLRRSAVDLRYVATGAEPTTLAIVQLAAGHDPAFAFYNESTADRLLTPGDLPEEFGDDVTALHFGSISLVSEPSAATLEACMLTESDRRVITLDPNVRPSLIRDHSTYVKRLERWVRASDLVKTSLADMGWIYPGVPYGDAVRRWLRMGPRCVVVTRGEAGATAMLSSGATIEVPASPVAVADAVGAGDAFMAALLVWLQRHDFLRRHALAALSTESLAAAIRFANRVAAITCTRVGADPPYASEVLEEA